MGKRWQAGDRVKGDRPQDVGTVRSHEEQKLIIDCDDGGILHTSQESAEELGWRKQRAWVAVFYNPGANRVTDPPVERSVFWASSKDEAEQIAESQAAAFSWEAEWDVYQDDDEIETLNEQIPL